MTLPIKTVTTVVLDRPGTAQDQARYVATRMRTGVAARSLAVDPSTFRRWVRGEFQPGTTDSASRLAILTSTCIAIDEAIVPEKHINPRIPQTFMSMLSFHLPNRRPCDVLAESPVEEAAEFLNHAVSNLLSKEPPTRTISLV